jgi:hypothetical protein
MNAKSTGDPLLDKLAAERRDRLINRVYHIVLVYALIGLVIVSISLVLMRFAGAGVVDLLVGLGIIVLIGVSVDQLERGKDLSTWILVLLAGLVSAIIFYRWGAAPSKVASGIAGALFLMGFLFSLYEASELTVREFFQVQLPLSSAVVGAIWYTFDRSPAIMAGALLLAALIVNQVYLALKHSLRVTHTHPGKALMSPRLSPQAKYTPSFNFAAQRAQSGLGLLVSFECALRIIIVGVVWLIFVIPGFSSSPTPYILFSLFAIFQIFSAYLKVRFP